MMHEYHAAGFRFTIKLLLIWILYFICSIGSLGADGSSDYVSNVMVNRATLSGTTNGLRIKTWQVT